MSPLTCPSVRTEAGHQWYCTLGIDHPGDHIGWRVDVRDSRQIWPRVGRP